jgi:inorganic pyrophosphatase
VFLVSTAFADVPLTTTPAETPLAEGVTYADPLTLDGPIDFLRDIPAKNPDGTVNIVVEIPSGTNQKWEVKNNGKMEWDKKNGKPRIVAYMCYPGNYGSIPSTQQLDGDPLDLIALGPAFPRASIVPVRIIGVIVIKDDGEQDDKLFGVVPGTPLGDVTSLKELNERFRGALEILKIFFSYYKGPDGGGMVFEGVGDEKSAMKAVDQATAMYEAKNARAGN